MKSQFTGSCWAAMMARLGIQFGDHWSHLKGKFPRNQAGKFQQCRGARIPLQFEDKKFVETRFYFTDPDVFEVFSFPLIEGDPQKCLTAPFSVAITASAARRYFGESDPMGKMLKLDWSGAMYDLTVTGILTQFRRTLICNLIS